MKNQRKSCQHAAMDNWRKQKDAGYHNGGGFKNNWNEKPKSTRAEYQFDAPEKADRCPACNSSPTRGVYMSQKGNIYWDHKQCGTNATGQIIYYDPDGTITGSKEKEGFGGQATIGQLSIKIDDLTSKIDGLEDMLRSIYQSTRSAPENENNKRPKY